jgi:multidrug efflux pump subunit AcrB
VRVRLGRAHRSGAGQVDSIDLLPAPGAPGARRPIPLSAVAHTDVRSQEGAITRRDGRRVNTVQGYVSAGVLPSTVLTAYRDALEKAGFAVPAGYRIEFGGEEAERNRAVSYLMGSVAVLMLLMVAVLVLSFRSFRLTALILVIGGLSVGLALMALFVFGQHFGFMAIVGTMGLVGVAINDSIAVLAGLQADKRVAAGDVEATVEVVYRSTRHVLATTVTTIAGFLPLLIAGGGFWPPLAISIAGGVAGASVLALFFLPAAYRVLVVRRVLAARVEVGPAGDLAPQPAT